LTIRFSFIGAWRSDLRHAFFVYYMEENEMIAFSKKFDVLKQDIKLHLS